MPAAGWPVASMTISTSGAAITAVRVVGDERRAVVRGVGERARRAALGGPSDARERRARARGREVGDRDDVDARRVLRLREVHRPELAGADQRDPERLALRPRAAAACDGGSSPCSDWAPSKRRGRGRTCRVGHALPARAAQRPSRHGARRRRRRRAARCRPSRAAASTLMTLSSTNSTRSAGTPTRLDHVREVRGVRLELADEVRRKVVVERAVERPLRSEKRAQWISLVFDTLASR